MGKAEVKAAEEMYQLGLQKSQSELETLKGEMEAIRQESQAVGALTAITANLTYNEMLRAVTLQRIKQAKEYKKGGMTWDEFCEAIGMPRRTVDLMLEDLRPVIDAFSASFAGFCGMPFSKIRLLGKSISANLAGFENGAICYDGETIPITPENADDIQALIERIDEEAKKLKEDSDADLKAKDRVLKAKEDVIKKQEKELAKLAKDARKHDLTPEEDAFCKRMLNSRVVIDGFLLDFDPDRNPLPETATPRMRAAYMETIGYLKRAIGATYDTAADIYGDPDMDDSWVPPHLRKEGQPPAPRSAACVECRSKAPEKCADKCCNTCSPRCHDAVVCLENEEFTD